MTEHCDLTMQFSNTSDQRGKRSLEIELLRVSTTLLNKT